jgi:hypothetical protein
MIPGSGRGRIARLLPIDAEIHAVSGVLQVAQEIDFGAGEHSFSNFQALRLVGGHKALL